MLLFMVLTCCVGIVVCDFDPELDRKFKTLPAEEFTRYFNSLNNSWKITNYGEEVKMAYEPTSVRKWKLAYTNYPVKTHDVKDIPENFDSRQKWPQCETIREVYNQGDCYSCYLFGSINTASDRTCIHAGVNVRLSVQEGDCIQPGYACMCGWPMDGFKFWQNEGLVTEGCKVYNLTLLREEDCILSCDRNIWKTDAGKILHVCKPKGVCSNVCVNSTINYSDDKHFAESVYMVENKTDVIRAEIFKNGPVEASFAVYDDFQNYRGGVYEHLYGRFLGMHSVRIVGFGREDGKDYWLVANSWGPHWGDKGFIKFKRDQKDLALAIESMVHAGLPKKEKVL